MIYSKYSLKTDENIWWELGIVYNVHVILFTQS